MGRALQACFALIARARAWAGAVSIRLDADLDVRVGAHCGLVVVSRLGPDSHQHITIAGDTVNVASRLLEVASSARATLAVSAELLAATGDFALTHSGDWSLSLLEIRGRREPLRVGVWHGGARVSDAAACKSSSAAGLA